MIQFKDAWDLGFALITFLFISYTLYKVEINTYRKLVEIDDKLNLHLRESDWQRQLVSKYLGFSQQDKI